MSIENNSLSTLINWLLNYVDRSINIFPETSSHSYEKVFKQMQILSCNQKNLLKNIKVISPILYWHYLLSNTKISIHKGILYDMHSKILTFS